MKKGFGLLEFVIVVCLFIAIAIPLFGYYSRNIINKNSQTGRIEQQKYIDSQVKIIEDAKSLQIKRLEMLNQGN